MLRGTRDTTLLPSDDHHQDYDHPPDPTEQLLHTDTSGRTRSSAKPQQARASCPTAFTSLSEELEQFENYSRPRAPSRESGPSSTACSVTGAALLPRGSESGAAPGERAGRGDQ